MGEAVVSEGPFDLNIPVVCSNHTTLLAMVKRAIALGYTTVALNTEVNQSQFITRKEKGKKEQGGNMLLDFPAPTQLSLEPSDYPLLAGQGLKPTILNRLTINMTNNDFMIAYNKSSIAKQYDLLAISCSSSPGLLALLKSSFRFDIICFQPDSVVSGVKWTRKLYVECLERNVHFELNYAPMIRSSVDRRRVISQAHTYQAVGRSRAVLLSSGARAPLELRAPTDVANLGFLLGLKQGEGVAAVRAAGAKVQRAALGRRMGPFRVRVMKLTHDNRHLAPKDALTEEAATEDESVMQL